MKPVGQGRRHRDEVDHLALHRERIDAEQRSHPLGLDFDRGELASGHQIEDLCPQLRTGKDRRPGPRTAVRITESLERKADAHLRQDAMRRARGRGTVRRLMNPHRFAEAGGFSARRELPIAADDVRGVHGPALSKATTPRTP